MPPTEESKSPYSPPESTLQAQDKVFCRECGASMLRSATQCSQCGAIQQSSSGRSKVAAGFLAFFLGGFGIHRFYLGQWWGVFYIPFAFFGISGFVSFIEAIVFWCTSQESWDKKYGHLGPANGWVIFAICIFPIIALIGILAAIALPAYQDYTIRAKVNEGIITTKSYRDEFEISARQLGYLPNSNSEAGIPQDISTKYVESVTIVRNGDMVITFKPFYQSAIENHTLIFSPEIKNGDFDEWSCKKGDLPNRLRPAHCRNE